MAQGKAWNKEEVVEVLKPHFQLGCSIQRACDYAGIASSTVKTWIENDETLRLKITSWQNELSLLARKNWKESLVEGRPTKFGPDKYTPAAEWLQVREKEDFSKRTETDITTGGQPLHTMTPIEAEAAKAYEEVMRKALLE